ncbi:MAG: hypothetical protein ACKPKO_33780, partial [Candidatus Fonsibacter sp.]
LGDQGFAPPGGKTTCVFHTRHCTFTGGGKPTTARRPTAATRPTRGRRRANLPVAAASQQRHEGNCGKPTNHKRRQTTTLGRRRANCGPKTEPARGLNILS